MRGPRQQRDGAARRYAWLGVAFVGGMVAGSLPAAAQSCPSTGIVELQFVPTGRAQIALWVERADGSAMQTVRLTQAVAYRGIGNRPGASQFNSGFRWPYGRREGVLPVWAHRRAALQGTTFARIIFQNRTSEGHASRSSDDYSPDDYFCLSFNQENSKQAALDAVSCASVLRSDKGRSMTQADAVANYAEPWQDEAGQGSWRTLPLRSLYPPRRDVGRCVAKGCYDSSDIDLFAREAQQAMPEIDAVTMATPAADSQQSVAFLLPPEWGPGDYVAYLEANVEGDHNVHYDPGKFPTPSQPAGAWDSWAQGYGYAYRGQPSVVYAVPFKVGSEATVASTAGPLGTGSLDGSDGSIRPLDGTLSDDTVAAPGSGADRLRRQSDGSRLRARVAPGALCGGEQAPAACGQACQAEGPAETACAEGYRCNAQQRCVGLCDECLPPAAVTALSAVPHPDSKQAHQWALLRFVVPAAPRPLLRYEVRVSQEPITDEASFARALPANAASLDSVELAVPVEGSAGSTLEVAFGGLKPNAKYYVAVRPIDRCYAAGALTVAEGTTSEVQYAKVSPCFVATAAYGSPMAGEVEALRRFRDGVLQRNVLGRMLVRAYYRVGPHAAGWLRRSAGLRWSARLALHPWVMLARWWGEQKR